MCIREKKILAEIQSQEEQKELENFVKKHAAHSNLWIGLTFSDILGDFKWDSTRATPIFTNWDKGYPIKNAKLKCVVMFKGKWRNDDCNYNSYGVCQEGKRRHS